MIMMMTGKKKLALLLCTGVISLAMIGSGAISAITISSQFTVKYVNGETSVVEAGGDSQDNGVSSVNSSSGETSSSETSSGDASPSSSSSATSNASQAAVTVAAGYIRPKALSGGGYGVQETNYRFEIYKYSSGYKTRIVDNSGKIVETQVNPINIQIKKTADAGDLLGNKSKTEMITGNYQKVVVKNNTIIATAEVKSTAGSVFAVTDQYFGSKSGNGFELVRDIKVVSGAAGDDGFNSIVKFKEENASTYDNYEYFIPSILFKNSSNLTLNAIGAKLSLDNIWVKDTNMGTPMVMTRNKTSGNCFTLGRVTSKVYTGIDESQSSWVVSKNIDYSSIGISNTEGYVSVDLCYPGIEGSVNYNDSNTSYIRRSHPVRDDVKHTYHVSFSADNSGSFNNAMVSAYQAQFAKEQIPAVNTNLDKVYKATLSLLDDYTYEYAPGKTGMPFALKLTGDIAALDYCMGFVGQQTSAGFQLIRNGIKTNSSAQRQKGEAIVDFWVNDSFTSYGFPKIWYATLSNVWAPANVIPCFMRYMSDGMEGILDSYLEEQSAGTAKTAWFTKCVTFADWLVNNQNLDGSYYRAYDQNTGKVYSVLDEKNATSKSNTTCPIRYLIRMYEQTKNENYLKAAVKAGEYAYSEFYLNGKYYGGTPDGKNVVDREAAIMALYAFDSLYEATGSQKWLDAAQHAAVCAASFVYTFDYNVWGKEKYNIYRTLTGTSGLSIITTGGNSVDTFAAYLYYEYFKLYIYTGNSFYYDFAKLLQNNTKQFINIDGSLPYGKDGLISEAQNISKQYFASSVDVCLLWCNIAMVDPIAAMEDAFGVDSIEAANALGLGRLQQSLKDYGSGGLKR